MSIKETLEKIKPFYTLIMVLVLGSIFFALGRLSAIEDRHVPIKIVSPNIEQSSFVAGAIVSPKTTPTLDPVKTSSINSSQSGSVVGSKSGKKYYFPWCGTVKRIKPENQVHFTSIDEAKKAGFTAGGNCKGLR